MAKFVFLVIMPILFWTCSSMCVHGREFVVGDDLGWRQPEETDSSVYTRWAGSIRFKIGDSVIFRYDNDSVFVVEKKDYYHCDTSDPVAVFTDGNTAIKLDSSGPIYYISGTLDHCKNGQRLIVEVLGAPRPHPPSPSSPESSVPILPPSPAPAPSSAASVYISALSLAVVIACGALCGLLVH